MRLSRSPTQAISSAQPPDTYQAQRRGGRGITGLSHKDEDFVEELFLGSTHDYMLFVTDMGRVYRLKGYQVPEGSRTSKGVNIVNLLPAAERREGHHHAARARRRTTTKALSHHGDASRASSSARRCPAYRNIRKSGLIAISLNEGDSPGLDPHHQRRTTS